MIGRSGERGSGISVLAARHDDDDEYMPVIGHKDKIRVFNYISKLATVVEGNPKAPFSTATTPMSRGGHHSFPWIAPLYP